VDKQSEIVTKVKHRVEKAKVNQKEKGKVKGKVKVKEMKMVMMVVRWCSGKESWRMMEKNLRLLRISVGAFEILLLAVVMVVMSWLSLFFQSLLGML
jgi:hypothetical protein